MKQTDAAHSHKQLLLSTYSSSSREHDERAPTIVARVFEPWTYQMSYPLKGI